MGVNHPMAIICQELLHDQDSADMSIRALECMLDLRSSLDPSDVSVVYRSLVAVLRRNGDLDGALEKAAAAAELNRFRLGAQSDKARRAAADLAHVYMATRSENGLWRALMYSCAAVVREVSNDVGMGEEAPCYGDGIAVYSMEDIAEIYQL